MHRERGYRNGRLGIQPIRCPIRCLQVVLLTVAVCAISIDATKQPERRLPTPWRKPFSRRFLILSMVEVRAGRKRHPPSARFLVSLNMTRSIRDSKNSRAKRGRPKTTGAGQPQVVRMHDQQIAEIDAWIAMQGGEMSRPEAIRRLVEVG